MGSLLGPLGRLWGASVASLVASLGLRWGSLAHFSASKGLLPHLVIHSGKFWQILEVPILGSDFGTFSVQSFIKFWGCFLLPFRVCEALSDELWETAFLKDLPIKMLSF